MRLINAEVFPTKHINVGEDEYGVGFDNGVQMMLDVIKDAPTVDAVPVVHSYWIGEDYDGYADGCPVYYSYRCSKCNTLFETDDEPIDFDFCPHCGAKTDEQ